MEMPTDEPTDLTDNRYAIEPRAGLIIDIHESGSKLLS
jgi:hypothetical protein